MDPMVSCFVVLLLYAIPTQSTSLDERVSKLETLVREQSIQMVEQRRRMESMEKVIVKQQNEITDLKTQLTSLRITNPDQKLARSNTTNILHDTSKPVELNDTKKMPIIREAHIPFGSGQLRRAITGTTAFYAYMSQTEKSPSAHHTLIFDHIVTNINTAYSHYTGTFMAPSAGPYVFTYSIRMGCTSYGAIEFVHNARVVGVFYNEHNNDCEGDTVSATIVLNVYQGDVVFVRTHATRSFSGNIESDTHGRSSFCGWSV